MEQREIEELAELLIEEALGDDLAEYLDGKGGPARQRVLEGWPRALLLPTAQDLDAAWEVAREQMEVRERRCAGYRGGHSVWAYGPWVRRGEGGIDCASCGARS